MILGRAYLREIALHLLMVLGGVTALVSLGVAVHTSSISQGAPIWLPVALLPLAVARLLPYLVSVTLLVAVILTYGRMAADREEVAVRAAGMNPGRLMLPALLAGTIVAGLTYPFSSEVYPRVYSAYRNLTHSLRYAVLQNPAPPASELHAEGLHLMWNGRDPDGSFREVTFFYRPEAGFKAFAGDPGEAKLERAEAKKPISLRAERASLRMDGTEAVLTLKGASTFGESSAGEAWAMPRLESFEVRYDLSQKERRDIEKKTDDYSSSELSRIMASGELTTDGKTRELTTAEVERYEFAFWQRVAVAVSAIPLALLGAMLGWRLRRGGFLVAFAAAFGGLFVFYYPFFYLGNTLQQAGTVSPFIGAWLPILVLAPVLGILSRVPRL